MIRKQIPLLGLIVILSCLCNVQTQSDSSEEKTGGLPIIRQINKVNDDGTYTYGYEAADGSFKIETRDVLGNVKGMFGFIDEAGDLKRVSYTANNETGFRNSVVHSPVSTTNRPSELGRRPVLLVKNNPALHLSTKGPVIQHIPKKTKDDDEEPSTEYTSLRRFSKNDTSEDSIDETKPSPLRKVLVSKRPVEEKEIKGKGGNSLRRQLNRGLDLRGEMTHIYAGGDTRYSPALPPHLSALMSELRPIQLVRSAPPESVGYQTVDVEGASQELNEVPSTTTTELPPYGTRKPLGPSPGYISARYRRPVPIAEESQYLQEVTASQYRPVLPHGLLQQLPGPNLNYQTQPQYYDQGLASIPVALRDELMAIIYNYLQVRLNQVAHNPYYGRLPYSAPYQNPALFTPAYPYSAPNYAPVQSNYPPIPANYPPVPYGNPYLAGPQQYYPPPYANPNLYVVPTQTPYSGPNVQFARPDQQQRRPVNTRVQTTRAAAAGADDADLLQMLLASPTRIPVHQVRYSPTTERILTSKTGQPVRNLQIITDTTESRPLTAETPE